MPSPGLLVVFAIATAVLTVTPGPGVLYVVGRSIGGGRRAGLASMAGIESGEAIYIAAAALGLTAVLATSAIALSVVRYAGAAYLVVLGIKAWRHPESEEASDDKPASNWAAYRRGLVVQLLNPKVAVFFVAYFPQFIRPGQPIAPQVLVLGCIYLVIAVVIDTGYVLMASWIAAKIARTERARQRRARVSAVIYFALAAAALVIGDRGNSSVKALASAR
jgi:threonine/homoserine/homoserine lactone efflux protein